MKLKKIQVKGFRSIKDELELVIDPKITVILGANDHGKSNLLDALIRLNDDRTYEATDDLNWDLDGLEESLPNIRWQFEFSDQELASLDKALSKKHLLAALRREAAQIIAEISKYEITDTAPSEGSVPANIVEAETPTKLDRPESILSESLVRHLEKKYLNAAFEIAALNFGETVDAADENPKSLIESLVQKTKRRKSRLQELQTISTKISELKTSLAQANANGDKTAVQKLNKEVVDHQHSERAIQREIEANQDIFDAISVLLDNAETLSTWRERTSINAAKLDIPREVTVYRKGVKGDLEIPCSDELADIGFDYETKRLLPAVELIRFNSGITDAVTYEQIDDDDYEFMRGIFYYAGLQRDEWESTFIQNDRTERRLQTASRVLNETLKKNWSQGKALEFSLSHLSSEGKIKLQIQDPSVSKRFVRASQRSTGFTNFFLLKTILHARRQESSAASFIWLFDEPGVYLHPHGQNDLLQALEALSNTNQILYCTHSLFMLNKNYPQRHRLVMKSKTGTVIDQKPYKAQWNSAISALGLGLPGTILFASKVALVEGDSDPIYINGVLQKFISEAVINVDINSLSLLPTGQSKNADALIRFLSETSIKPKIVMIFDGDEGGRERHRKLNQIANLNKIESKFLNKKSIEDCLPYVEDLLPKAVCKYVAKMTKKDPEDLFEQVKPSLENVAKLGGWAEWSRVEGARLGGLDGELSPVGVAREYIELLENYSVSKEGLKDNEILNDLIPWMIKELDLAENSAPVESILIQKNIA